MRLEQRERIETIAGMVLLTVYIVLVAGIVALLVVLFTEDKAWTDLHVLHLVLIALLVGYELPAHIEKTNKYRPYIALVLGLSIGAVGFLIAFR